MKDVSEILAKCLKSLETPFSRGWIADFSSFMEFIRANPSTIQILESMKEQKEDAHTPLIQSKKAYLKKAQYASKRYAEIACKEKPFYRGQRDVNWLLDSTFVRNAKKQIYGMQSGLPFHPLLFEHGLSLYHKNWLIGKYGMGKLSHKRYVTVDGKGKSPK